MHCTQVLSKYPDSVEGLVARGKAYQAAGQRMEGLKDLNLAKLRSSRNKEVFREGAKIKVPGGGAEDRMPALGLSSTNSLPYIDNSAKSNFSSV